MVVVDEVLVQDPLVTVTLYTPLAVGMYVFVVALGITTSSLYQTYVPRPVLVVNVVLLAQASPMTVIVGVEPVMEAVIVFEL